MYLNDVDELGADDHGDSLALEAELVLEVAEEVAEVDVEELAVLAHHDVVVVPVPDAQDVGAAT